MIQAIRFSRPLCTLLLTCFGGCIRQSQDFTIDEPTATSNGVSPVMSSYARWSHQDERISVEYPKHWIVEPLKTITQSRLGPGILQEIEGPEESTTGIGFTLMRIDIRRNNDPAPRTLAEFVDLLIRAYGVGPYRVLHRKEVSHAGTVAIEFAIAYEVIRAQSPSEPATTTHHRGMVLQKNQRYYALSLESSEADAARYQEVYDRILSSVVID